jgi:hypothetical protein
MDSDQQTSTFVTASGGALADRMVDAAGRPMLLRSSGAARSRYYVSEGAAERIAADRLERHGVGLLQQLHLIDRTWLPVDVAKILRRIVVCPDCLVFQLDRPACITVWRASGHLRAHSTSADVLRLIETWLPQGVEIADAGWVLCLTVPRRTRSRKSRLISRVGQT